MFGSELMDPVREVLGSACHRKARVYPGPFTRSSSEPMREVIGERLENHTELELIYGHRT